MFIHPTELSNLSVSTITVALNKEARFFNMPVQELVIREVCDFKGLPRPEPSGKSYEPVYSVYDLGCDSKLLLEIEDIYRTPPLPEKKFKISPIRMIWEVGSRLALIQTDGPVEPLPFYRTLDPIGRLPDVFTFKEYQSVTGNNVPYSRITIKTLLTTGYVVQKGAILTPANRRPALTYSASPWYRRYLEKLGVEVNNPTHDT